MTTTRFIQQRYKVINKKSRYFRLLDPRTGLVAFYDAYLFKNYFPNGSLDANAPFSIFPNGVEVEMEVGLGAPVTFDEGALELGPIEIDVEGSPITAQRALGSNAGGDLPIMDVLSPILDSTEFTIVLGLKNISLATTASSLIYFSDGSLSSLKISVTETDTLSVSYVTENDTLNSAFDFDLDGGSDVFLTIVRNGDNLKVTINNVVCLDETEEDLETMNVAVFYIGGQGTSTLESSVACDLVLFAAHDIALNETQLDRYYGHYLFTAKPDLQGVLLDA